MFLFGIITILYDKGLIFSTNKRKTNLEKKNTEHNLEIKDNDVEEEEKRVK
jgi:hypothetical protein